MPFDRVPNRISGSAGRSLLACGQTGASAALAIPAVGPDTDMSKRAAIAARDRSPIERIDFHLVGSDEYRGSARFPLFTRVRVADALGGKTYQMLFVTPV